ncbi:MAG TPA: hypothetical protein VM123_08880 [archaeon]|nr:hypothetical protein [archaeon]
MDQETLADILAQILTTNEKWRQEVERNVLLQNTIEDLFTDQVFQDLLENLVLPKFEKTNIPHFRAIELICSFRELARQLHEGNASQATVDRELEELMFKVNDKWGTGTGIDVSQSPAAALKEAERIVRLYKEDPQFTARLDRFRLLVLPLSVSEGNSKFCQILVLENIRPPRNQWSKKIS